MTDMIERAAKALYVCESVRAGHTARVVSEISGGPSSFTIEPFEDCADTAWRPDARAALLAALDPEDEALRNGILGAMGFVKGDDDSGFSSWAHNQARDALKRLQAMAQGEL